MNYVLNWKSCMLTTYKKEIEKWHLTKWLQMEWMLATWSSGNPRALVNEPLRRYSAVILSNCLQSVDSQLTVLQNFSFRQMVYIILNQTCQMHPTKQEVHPTFRPMHPTCRIVSKWPTFSIKGLQFWYKVGVLSFCPKVLEIRHFQKNGSSERIIFRPGRAVFVLKYVRCPAFLWDEIVHLWV